MVSRNSAPAIERSRSAVEQLPQHSRADQQKRSKFVVEATQRKLAAPIAPRLIGKDFFVADILEVAPKGDRFSMEYPFFALKAGDCRTRTFGGNGNFITVKPGPDGCATIHDKDLWIYCISQMVEASNRGREISRVIRITAHDFFRATNRDVSGRAYTRLTEMLARLCGTRIETSIETGGQRERGYFGLIDAARVIARDTDNRMLAVEITLPDWLFRSVATMQVLTLSRDYFHIRKPLDRRVYELARKHCGKQASWSITLRQLCLKSGSMSRLSDFRIKMRKLVAARSIPDYDMSYDATCDKITFRLNSRSNGSPDGLNDKVVGRSRGSLGADEKANALKVWRRQALG